MKKYLKILILCSLLFCPISQLSAQIIFNEFMASNSGENADPDYNETADWIELYNSGSEVIQLKSFFLSDNISDPYKWQISVDVEIGVGKYLIIWADGNDEGLHTNFKLSALGEELVISTPLGVIIDSIKFGSQVSNISMGRKSIDSNELVYFTEPTPGLVNSTKSFFDIVRNSPSFSVKGGIYDSKISLSISNKFHGIVRYTLDGSQPNEFSSIASGLIEITDNSVVRARIFNQGMVPGPVVTNSYFFRSDNRINSLPIISISTEPDNLWDDEKGIYAQNSKPEWEIPINIELFENDGSDRAAFNLNAGMKINGLYSWQLPQKMLGIYFRKKYGDGKLEYPLIFDKGRSSFKTFALRASGSDWSYSMFRDAMVQNATMGNTDLDNSGFRACIVYFNGQYMGIHNIREKIDEDFIVGNHGLNEGSIDMVENENYAESGSLDEYLKFKESYLKDLSVNDNWDSVSKMMNVINFTDLICTEIYDGNTSISHNIMAWKPKNEGLWKWIIMDLDRGFFNVGNHLINYYINQDEWPFYKMMDNDFYRHYFGKRLADHLFTTFNQDRIKRLIDRHTLMIEMDMPYHIKRWKGTSSSYGDPIPSMDYWYDDIIAMKFFADERPAILLNDLSKYGFKDPIPISVSVYPENGGKLLFNGLKVPSSVNVGGYPQGEEITLSALENNGYKFKGWKSSEQTFIISKESEWKYNDSGIDPGIAWKNVDYNDSSWKTGVAELGYGDNDENTIVSYGGNDRDKFPATYFRKVFNVDNITNLTKIKASIKCDDGAIVYLNGEEIFRYNMPTGLVNFQTFASSSAGSEEEDVFNNIDFESEMLREGVNLIAVEVHQVNASSSDLSFDFIIEASTIGDNNFVSTENVFTTILEKGMDVTAVFENGGYCEIPSEITGSYTLTKDCSPYITTGDVKVLPGGKLIINQGVEIYVQDGASFIVDGSIIAKGIEKLPIIFCGNPMSNERTWGTIKFINTTDSSVFSNVIIKEASYGGHPVQDNSAISLFNSQIILDSITIIDVEGNPISARYSDVSLKNSTIHSKITGDLINVKYGKGYIDNCEFIGNDKPDTDAIDFDGLVSGVINNSRISGFQGLNSDAVDIGERCFNVDIDNILVHDITDKGISVGQQSIVSVSNSTFIKCNLGAGLKDSSNVNIDQCTFYGNNIAVSSFEKNPGDAGANVSITNSIFSNSYESTFYFDEYSKMIIQYSNSDNDSLPEGYKNIFSDPLFKNPVLYDFSLLQGSFCIDNGSDGNIGSKKNNNVLSPDVMISDIAYLTDPTLENLEFVGIFNAGNDIIDISGYSFQEGIVFTFPEGIFIYPKAKVYVTSNSGSSFWYKRGANVFQWESGKLADEGEKIKLVSDSGIPIDQVRYNNKEPWPLIPNSDYAISLKGYDVDNHFGKNWILLSKDLIVNKDEKKFEQSLKIFPNPTNGIVNISGAGNDILFIEVFDMQGKQIIKEPSFKGTAQINLRNFKTGIYLIKAGVHTGKIVVE